MLSFNVSYFELLDAYHEHIVYHYKSNYKLKEKNISPYDTIDILTDTINYTFGEELVGKELNILDAIAMARVCLEVSGLYHERYFLPDLLLQLFQKYAYQIHELDIPLDEKTVVIADYKVMCIIYQLECPDIMDS